MNIQRTSWRNSYWTYIWSILFNWESSGEIWPLKKLLLMWLWQKNIWIYIYIWTSRKKLTNLCNFRTSNFQSTTHIYECTYKTDKHIYIYIYIYIYIICKPEILKKKKIKGWDQFRVDLTETATSSSFLFALVCCLLYNST